MVHQDTDCAKKDKPSPGTSLEVTREQTTWSEYVCVGTSDQKHKSLTLHPSWGTRVCVCACDEQTDKSPTWDCSPGDGLCVCEQTSLPLAPLSKLPGDRLH